MIRPPQKQRVPSKAKVPSKSKPPSNTKAEMVHPTDAPDAPARASVVAARALATEPLARAAPSRPRKRSGKHDIQDVPSERTEELQRLIADLQQNLQQEADDGAHPRRKRGRPPSDNPADSMVHVRLTTDLKTKLEDERAQRLDSPTLAALVREAIVAFISPRKRN